ncbi:MAG: hypothetical protein GX444_03945 [Myxococcales bacterium]|nr:hypothetical protein [Myxococcales bacterium]
MSSKKKPRNVQINTDYPDTEFVFTEVDVPELPTVPAPVYQTLVDGTAVGLVAEISPGNWGFFWGSDKRGEGYASREEAALAAFNSIIHDRPGPDIGS